MLNDGELTASLQDIESDRVERKASVSDRKEIKQAICAFANDMSNSKMPGVIFIGVHNDGGCSNLPITDELLLMLSDMRSNGNILPFPIMSVQKKMLNGCAMAVIEVEPSDETPVRLDGRVWIRIGPSRRTATSAEERALSEKRRSNNLPFDHRPLKGSSLEELDLDFFKREYLPNAVDRDVLEQNQRTINEQLASVRFLTADGIPTVVAMLVIGKDPRKWLPCAYIQFLRIDGVDITDPILNQREISGPLTEVLLNLDDLLKINIFTSSDVSQSTTEIKHPDFPIVALQQLSRNAVMHRAYEHTNAPVRINWFADRIEISNPGGLYGQVTQENFGKGQTDYRNPVLSEAMKTLGFVQRFGMGIPLAKKELHENGNPEPEFSFDGNNVLAIIRKRQ
ncbi:MAG: putative DNA binding domain-containing protein [Deltaproteobacteria bacterium]|nr:putative DNA binding domain-containing protein [Deltaproteobacteria bacterium]